MEDQSKAVQVFNFQGNDLRVEIIDGEPWFVGIDVCQGLGIANHRDAIANLPQKWKSVVGVTDPHGRIQPTLCIKEPALYKLAFRSNKPEAEVFTEWVAEEVLPSIRKTGSYGMPAKSATLPSLLFTSGQEIMEAAPLCPCPTRVQLEVAILSTVETLEMVTKRGATLPNLFGYSQECHAYLRAHGIDQFENVVASLVKRRMLTVEYDFYYHLAASSAGQITGPKE